MSYRVIFDTKQYKNKWKFYIVGGIIVNVPFPLEPSLEGRCSILNLLGQISILIFCIYLIYSLSLICNSIHTIRVIFFDLFLYVWGYSYRKRRLVLYICYKILCRLNLMMVALKTLMIKMDKVRLLKPTSLMIEIMRFFYIEGEYDTYSKVTQELITLILRGSL